MSPQDAAEQISRIIKRELDDCMNAINDKDFDTAASELDDAIRKLRRIARDLA